MSDEIARKLAPDLFRIIDAVAALQLAYPIQCKEGLHKGLFASANRFTQSGLSICPADVDAYFLDQFFPIQNADELVMRAYSAVMHAHGVTHEARRTATMATPRATSYDISVFCAAGQWTKVVEGVLIAGTYTGRFTPTHTSLHWRRYSAFPPFFTEGSHDTAYEFGATFVCDPYCDFWFNPSVDTTVTWAGRPAVCAPPFPKI